MSSDTRTPPGGRASIHPPRTVLGPEAQSDLLVRLVTGMEDIGNMMRSMRADLRLSLEEGRTHAHRLVALEEAIASLPCRRCDDCPERGDGSHT